MTHKGHDRPSPASPSARQARRPIALRLAAPLLLGSAAVIAGCGSSSKPSSTATPPTGTPAALTPAPTLTPGHDVATDASFRAFAEQVTAAMISKDTAFFQARLHETTLTCTAAVISSGRFPACVTEGQVVTGIGAAGWHGNGVIADRASMVRDLTGYAGLASTTSTDAFGGGAFKLAALGRLATATGTDGYVAILTEISTHSNPQTPPNRTARVLVCALYNNNWQIATVIAATDHIDELLKPNASNGFLKSWTAYP
ncbi:MAG TPA: hypothetical protein VEZ14_00280 [Dehalococcoidia bacterium]|nr:hypothetical protein [Dehalococcoidia bacterium]